MKAKKVIADVLILVLFLSLVIAIYFLFFKQDFYYTIEKEMVEKAKDYVSKNNLKIDPQEYIFIDDLSVKNTELCSKSSGVIATKINDKIQYTPYLKCSDYESKIINNDNTYIELNGGAVEIVKKGSMYLDKGFKKNKDVVVTTIGEVPDEIGAYTINYVIKENDRQKAISKRIVIVTDCDNSLIEIDDATAPIITLNGEDIIVVELKENFEDPGFVAYDQKDGNLTQQVKVDNKVNTKKIGKYEIKYSVVNSDGQSANIIRVVNVVSKKAKLDITADVKTDEGNIIIELKTIGDGFKKVILPNNETSELTINNYKVSENGKYTFKIIDTYNNEIYKTIVISNVDNEVPTGECVATRYEKEYVIKVNAYDNIGIKGIIYIVNNNDSGLFNAFEYKTGEIIETAEVVIVDMMNNKTRITCKIND